LLNLCDDAKEIANKAHHGQIDKGGSPYIEHPLAVANSVVDLEQKIVALLHDVLEDSHLSANDLLQHGFTKRIVRSIQTLTKQDDESYESYLARVKCDNNALNVKIADIKHNLDISRIPNATQADYDRLEKYKKALAFLEE
jgi:(p)ppGpp synthase/HD superfamily hydrolase